MTKIPSIKSWLLIVSAFQSFLNYTLSSEHWRCKMFFLFARDLEFNKLKKNIVLEGKESYISGNNHQQSYHLQDTQFCT